MKTRWLPVVLLILGATGVRTRSIVKGESSHPDFDAACDSDNPYYATSLTFHFGSSGSRPVMLFRDTDDESVRGGINPDTRGLGEDEFLGSLYGLAFDPAHDLLFASAFRSLATEFGAGGEGAVYSLPLSGEPSLIATSLDAGDGRPSNLADPVAALGDVLTRGLGDLDISSDGQFLVASNLLKQEIDVIEVQSGVVVTHFSHGARNEVWAGDARIFGLGMRGDHIYHGVVNSAGSRFGSDSFVANIYRSDYAGNDMRLVGTIPLQYEREPKWGAWDDDISANVSTRRSQPFVADIDFDDAGFIIVGLGDRQYYQGRHLYGGGDIVRVPYGGIAGSDDVNHFSGYNSSSNLRPGFSRYDSGSLAMNIDRNAVVASGLTRRGELVLDNMRWYGAASGNISPIVDGLEYVPQDNERIGDIELLCRATSPPEPTPTPTVTPTVSQSATPTESATPQVSPSASPSVMQMNVLYLPVSYRSECVRYDRIPQSLILVIDVSTSMRSPTLRGRTKLEAVQAAALEFTHYVLNEARSGSRIAVMGFNANAWVQLSFSSNVDAIARAIGDLSKNFREGTRIDRALGQSEALFQSLTDGGRKSIVLLTDGLPNGVPTPPPSGSATETILAIAAHLRRLGISVFVVGVGDPTAADPAARIDEGLLRGIAGAETRYFQTNDAELVDLIFRAISRSVICG